MEEINFFSEQVANFWNVLSQEIVQTDSISVSKRD